MPGATQKKGNDVLPNAVLATNFSHIELDIKLQNKTRLAWGYCFWSYCLAYAMLAGVPPITGLYMAFFPVLIYVIMGTSHHVSMGTLSIVCIMTSNAVLKYSTQEEEIMANTTILSTSSAPPSEVDTNLTPVQVATAVCFIVGVFQIVHDLVKNYYTANIVSIGISAVAISVLFLFTQFIKPMIEKRCHYPFPIELSAIILGTTLSSSLEIAAKYGVKTVGNIPLGLPSPQVPPLWLVPNIISDGATIAVVAFSINLSMASILAKKGNYSIKANQELLASGTGNIFASFFACVPFAASLSRSLIQQNVGGKTQIASLVSCLLLLLVMLVIGPFFESLPNCILASIVVVALRKMFDQFKDLPKAWKKSHIDGGVWLVTFVASVLFDIDYGLAIGIATSIMSVLYFSQRINILRLGNVEQTDLYLDLQRYKAIYKLIGIAITNSTDYVDDCDESQNESERQTKGDKVYSIVIDMQGVCFLDPSAAEALTSMHNDMNTKLGISVFFANIPCTVMDSLNRYGFFSSDFPSSSNAFPSLQDAVCHAKLLAVSV
ncbi:hypothetical protein B566_EDAN009356 [Ephemera danica]|nr:hypothetical protein B566_EDAN009356 [Ephemera danica]